VGWVTRSRPTYNHRSIIHPPWSLAAIIAAMATAAALLRRNASMESVLGSIQETLKLLFLVFDFIPQTEENLEAEQTKTQWNIHHL
jgi:hypothetical protein